MGNRYTLFILLFYLTLITINSCDNLPAYRLLQYKSGTVVYGSKKAYVNLLTTTLTSAPNLKSRAIIIPIESASLAQFENIISQGTPGAIIYIIPENTSELSEESLRNWNQLELYLIKNESINFPIYFTVENDQLKDLYNEIKANDNDSKFSPSGLVNIYIHSKEPAEIKDIELSVLQSFLPGQKSDQQTPSILISTYWDTFSTVPSQAYGCNESGVGLLTILSTMKYFSALYSSPSTIGRYNILFLISSGAKLDFEGTHQWLDMALTDEIRNSIEYTICLDSLSNTNDLFLHVSRPKKDPKAQKLYDIFTETSKKYGINFEVIQKKINISESTVLWEHELFARRKLLSVTLSSIKERNDHFQNIGLFDDYNHIKHDIVTRNIKYFIHTLSKIVYDFEENYGLLAENIINEEVSHGWIKSICSMSRMLPYVNSQNSIVEYIKNIMKQYLNDEVQLLQFKSKSQIKFYDREIATLQPYRAKPITFDIALSILVLIYNIILYAFLRGFRKTLDDIRVYYSNFFNRNKKRN